MQSEQRRQRRKQLKRLKQEKKRRALEGPQLCAPGEPRIRAQAEAVPLPPGGERTFWGAMRIARNLLGGRASAAQCIELIVRTYLASGRREPD